MTTASTCPGLSCVRALNCLQKSMIFTPLAPNAGPTGGDGFAAPPFTCNFTNALTSFAIVVLNLIVKCLLVSWKHYNVTFIVFRRLCNHATQSNEVQR